MCASRIDLAFPCVHNIFFDFRIAFFVILASSIVENSTDDLDRSARVDKMAAALIFSGAGGSQRRLAGGESRGEAEGEDQFFLHGIKCLKSRLATSVAVLIISQLISSAIACLWPSLATTLSASST